MYECFVGAQNIFLWKFIQYKKHIFAWLIAELVHCWINEGETVVLFF